MKDSGIKWIGEIPKEWEVVSVKNLFNITRGRVIPTEALSEEGYPVYSSQTLNNGCMGFIPTYDYSGDALTWTTDGANAGTVFFRTGQFNCTNVCGILQLKKELYNIHYLLYSVGHSSLHCRRADINGFKIMSNEMAAIKIVLPKALEEQQRIATYLDTKCGEIDELIGIQENFIEELKAYKQSVITEAVTKGLNPNAKMKDSGMEWIGKIPEEWNLKRLKFSCCVFGRIGFRGYTTDDLVTENEGAISLSPSNLIDMKMDYNKCTYISWYKYNESPEIQISETDVLLVKTGSSFGKCSYVDYIPKECTINPQIVVFKEHHDNPKFLSYMFQTPIAKYFVETSVVGGTIPTISQQKILNYKFIFPPLFEQHAIVTYLDNKCSQIDSLIALKQSKIEELKSFKKSLIYEYVTGKKIVPETV